MPRNFCQNPLCHLFDTDDRIIKGGYQTRKAKREWFNYFCTRECFHQFFEIHSDNIIRFIGLKTEPSIRPTENQNYWELKKTIQNQSTLNYLDYPNMPKMIYRQLNQN